MRMKGNRMYIVRCVYTHIHIKHKNKFYTINKTKILILYLPLKTMVG